MAWLIIRFPQLRVVIVFFYYTAIERMRPWLARVRGLGHGGKVMRRPQPFDGHMRL